MRKPVLLLAIVVVLATAAVASAQDATGSISGRIIVQGQPPAGEVISIFWVPADTPQPFDPFLFADNLVRPDENGTFTISGLADGDYFLMPPRSVQLGVALPETVQILADGQVVSLPALRVTISNGEAVTGIEIVVFFPTPEIIVEDFRSPSPPALPDTGTGRDNHDGPSVPVAVGIVLLASAALITAGEALRRFARG